MINEEINEYFGEKHSDNTEKIHFLLQNKVKIDFSKSLNWIGYEWTSSDGTEQYEELSTRGLTFDAAIKEIISEIEFKN